ncbi:MAG: hypothetical protein AAFX03_02615 [Pseudomonadota bacterium]
MKRVMMAAALTVGAAAFSPAAVADDLEDAARQAAACRSVDSAVARLDCLDAAAAALDAALNAPSAAAPAETAEAVPDWAAAPESAAPAPTPEPVQSAETPAPTEVAEAASAGTVPEWAEAPKEPERDEEGKPVEPDRFQVSIVRITVNNVGRHRFYTDDGQIWRQEQIEDFRTPSALPAVAEIRKASTWGPPWLTFEDRGGRVRVRREQ